MGLKICRLELVLGMQGIEKGTFSQTDLLFRMLVCVCFFMVPCSICCYSGLIGNSMLNRICPGLQSIEKGLFNRQLFPERKDGFPALPFSWFVH